MIFDNGISPRMFRFARSPLARLYRMR